MKQHPKHILVIRLSAMGDVAMTVPVLTALQESFPNTKITVLTKPFFGSIFEHLAFINIITAKVNDEHKGIFGLWKLHKQCRLLGIDTVADCHNVLRSKMLRFFFGLSGIKSTHIDKGRAEKKALTRAKNKILAPLKSTHERYAEVFRELNFDLKLKPLQKLKLSLTPAINEQFGIHSQNSELSSQRLIGIAPFAAHEGKQYPKAQMEQVIQMLNNSGKYKVLLFGGPNDVEALKNSASEKKHVISLAGKLTFEDEIKVISNLDLMVSMDSGNGHLAAMFNVTVITIWGVTHPFAGFVPFNQSFNNQIFPDIEQFPLLPTSIYGNIVPQGYENVMESIPPQMVFERIVASV